MNASIVPNPGGPAGDDMIDLLQQNICHFDSSYRHYQRSTETGQIIARDSCQMDSNVACGNRRLKSFSCFVKAKMITRAIVYVYILKKQSQP